ncbi:MAG: type II secretion system protein N [Pseudomonadales bacterium]
MLKVLAARLVQPIRWLLIAGIAWTVADGLLELLADGAPSHAPLAPTTISSGSRAPALVDIDRLIAGNLFGAEGANSASQGMLSSGPAVVTQLPLELQGVFAGADERSSAAIIAERGKPGRLYQIGESVAGTATLEAVQTDHVVLRRDGSVESLFFAQNTPSAVSSANPAYQDADAEQMRLMEEQYRAELERIEPFDEATPYEGLRATDIEDPGAEMTDPISDIPEPDGFDSSDSEPGATQGISPEDIPVDDPGYDASARSGGNDLVALGLSPISAASKDGYRVDSLAGADWLGHTGLQTGDVILSVNGRPVGNPAQDRLDIDNLKTEGLARIEIQRGTRRFFVTTQVP